MDVRQEADCLYVPRATPLKKGQDENAPTVDKGLVACSQHRKPTPEECRDNGQEGNLRTCPEGKFFAHPQSLIFPILPLPLQRPSRRADGREPSEQPGSGPVLIINLFGQRGDERYRDLLKLR
jgi:hypothetical protein